MILNRPFKFLSHTLSIIKTKNGEALVTQGCIIMQQPFQSIKLKFHGLKRLVEIRSMVEAGTG